MLIKGKKEPFRFPAFVFDNTKDKNESVLDNKATMQVVRRCETPLIKYLVVKKMTTIKGVPLQGFISCFSFRGSGEHNGLESQENKVAFVAISKSLPHFLFHSHVVRWQFQSSFLYCSVALGTDK